MIFLLASASGLTSLKLQWNTVITDYLFEQYRDRYLYDARQYFPATDIDKTGIDRDRATIPFLSDSTFDNRTVEEQTRIMSSLTSYDIDHTGLFGGHHFTTVTVRTPRGVYRYDANQQRMVPPADR